MTAALDDAMLIERYAIADLKTLPLYGIIDGGRCECRKRACKSPGKHPRLNFSEASIEVATVRGWLKRWPRMNLGLVLEDLVVLDEDPRNGGNLDNLGRPLPDTCIQRTGAGGRHFLYRRRPDVDYPGSGTVATGIDIKSGPNAFIVVEPSMHASGNRYCWIDESEPYRQRPALAPEWLQEQRTSHGRSDRGASAQLSPDDIERNAAIIRALLDYLGNPDSYMYWIEIGMAIADATDKADAGFVLWTTWAGRSKKFDLEEHRLKWATFKTGGGVTMATLVFNARSNGWKDQADDAQPSTTMTWGELLLPAAVKLPDLPCTLLPGTLGEMAADVTRHAQTPNGLAVLMILSTIALAAQSGYVVQPTSSPDYVEPVVLWCLVGLQSGSRKTQVLNLLTAPVHDFEDDERRRLKAEVARRFAARGIAEKRIEKLKVDAAKEGDEKKRGELQDLIQSEKQNMPDELFLPRLVVGDVTPERAQQLLVENDGALAIFSDEPALLEVLSGAYGGGHGAILDVFLKGHSGSPVHVERQTRSAHLRFPTVTLGLAIQTEVLAELGATRRFRDSGLLARMLLAVPTTTIGQRDPRRVTAIDPAIRKAYNDLITSVLRAARAPSIRHKTFTLDPAAQEEYFLFAEYIEGQMAPGAALEAMSDWAGKLPGQAARIAALLQLALDPAANVIYVDAMRRAVDLCRRLIEHAKNVFRLIGADEIEADAMVLLRWIVREQHAQFDRSKAQKANEGRFRTVERLKTGFARLHEWNVLSPERTRYNKGARPSPYYEVNPAVHSAGMFDFSRKPLEP